MNKSERHVKKALSSKASDLQERMKKRRFVTEFPAKPYREGGLFKVRFDNGLPKRVWHMMHRIWNCENIPNELAKLALTELARLSDAGKINPAIPELRNMFDWSDTKHRRYFWTVIDKRLREYEGIPSALEEVPEETPKRSIMDITRRMF